MVNLVNFWELKHKGQKFKIKAGVSYRTIASCISFPAFSILHFSTRHVSYPPLHSYGKDAHSLNADFQKRNIPGDGLDKSIL